MTTISDFKSFIKKLNNLREQLKSKNSTIVFLTRMDKNDSHKDVILKAINKRNTVRFKYTEMLSGHPYEYWIDLNKKISNLLIRINKDNKLIKKYEAINLLHQNELNELLNF